MSKVGSDKNIGKFDCSWLIIPFSEGATPAEKPEETLAKAQRSEDEILKTYNITPAPDYKQNAGYENAYKAKCVDTHGIDFAAEKAQSYWYHSDHLGSASYITGADGKVCSNITYFPTGEVFVEQNLKTNVLPYKFNGKELDAETGYYYYGARYYNPKVSLWLNVDPLAEQTGQPYIAFNNNPVRFIDPTGMASKPYDWYQKQSDGSYKNIKKSNDLRVYDEKGSRVPEYATNILGFPSAYNEDYVSSVNTARSQGVISKSDSNQASILSSIYVSEKLPSAIADGALLFEGGYSILKNPKAAWNNLKSGVAAIKSLFGIGKSKIFGHLTPFAQMTKVERRAFQHSYSKHASEFELPNWSQSKASELQTAFNDAVTNVRSAGANDFFKSQEWVNGVKSTVNRTEPVINGQKYYYYETPQGQFISAGKMP
jgi:RHS repeat-associated protein